MGLSLWGKSPFKNADPAVRLKAVRHATSRDAAHLERLALSDSDARVRIEAAKRISDPASAQRLLQSTDTAVQAQARTVLARHAATQARNLPLAQASSQIALITDGDALAELSLRASDHSVRIASLERLLDIGEPSEATLGMLAIQDDHGAVGERVLDRIERHAQLKSISKKAKVERVRKAAAERMQQAKAKMDKPSAQARRAARRTALNGIGEDAERLALTERWADAAIEFAELRARLAAAIAPYADLEDDGAVAQAKATLARAENLFNHRRAEAAAQAAAQAQAQAHSEAPASASPVAPAAITGNAPGAGVVSGPTYTPEELEKLEQVAAEAEAVCARLGIAVGSAAFSASADAAPAAPTPISREQAMDTVDRFRVLHKTLTQVVGSDRRLAQVQRFNAAYGAFKARRAADRDARTSQHQQAADALAKLAAQAEALAKLDPAPSDLAAQLKALNAAWRAVPSVPARMAAPLKQRFFAACDTAWAPLRERNEQEDWKRFAAATAAEELIASAEALAQRDDLPHLAGEVKRLQGEWKRLGALPRERAQALWDRFKAAGDAVFAKLQPWFAERDAARAANLTTKQGILQQLETLAAESTATVGLAGSAADKAARTQRQQRIKDLLQAFRNAGEVPREADQALWRQYRGLVEKLHGPRLSPEQEQQNLTAKEALCAEAEALADQATAAQAAGTPPSDGLLGSAKQLRERFDQHGHVPRAEVQRITKRWRAALDRFYGAYKARFAERDAERAANLRAKEGVLEQMQALAADTTLDAQSRKQRLYELSDQFRAIGQIPREAMDATAQRYRSLREQIEASLGNRRSAGAGDSSGGSGSKGPRPRFVDDDSQRPQVFTFGSSDAEPAAPTAPEPAPAPASGDLPSGGTT